jgi:hypothetical protein
MVSAQLVSTSAPAAKRRMGYKQGADTSASYIGNAALNINTGSAPHYRSDHGHQCVFRILLWPS